MSPPLPVGTAGGVVSGDSASDEYEEIGARGIPLSCFFVGENIESCSRLAWWLGLWGDETGMGGAGLELVVVLARLRRPPRADEEAADLLRLVGELGGMDVDASVGMGASETGSSDVVLRVFGFGLAGGEARDEGTKRRINHGS